MKRRLITVLLVMTAIPALAQQNASWTKAVEPFRMFGDTYYVGSEGLSVYMVATLRGNILIDAGTSENAVQIENSIRKLGFKLSDIKYLLNSHAHYDHSGGLAKLKADTGALVVASEGDRLALEKGVYVGSEEVKAYAFPPVKVDRVIKDGGAVSLGGVILTAHITPGHTKGCTTWTWPTAVDGETHTALNFCSASVAANRLVPEQYPGIVADYQKTFATARSISGDIFLAPHSDFFSLATKREKLGRSGPNPFIDRAGYERLLAAQEADFKRQLAQQQAQR